ncbi:MAG: hypothetical protein QOE94_3690 [Mycobacterium sp.]|jgi:hypothetical protein|nr:hypothetical protein [Mycobacterium sp.]
MVRVEEGLNPFFPLVFLKRISDVYDEERAAAMEIYGDDVSVVT